MRLINLKYYLLIFFFLGCIKDPTGSNAIKNINNFSERKSKLSFDKVMRELPNILELRNSIDLIISEKLDEKKLEGVKILIFEKPKNNIVYRGSILGILKLPKSRIRIAIQKKSDYVYAKIKNNDNEEVEFPLKVLEGKEVIISADLLDHPIFNK